MTTDSTYFSQIMVPIDEAADSAPPPESYLDESELRLIDRIRGGDERAFALLVRSYQDRVFSLSVRMLGNREEAEDLAQEIFVAIYKHIGDFRAEAQLSTWIYRVTRNRCLNRLKYLSRRKQASTDTLDSVPDRRLNDLSGRAPLRPDHHLEGRQLQSVLEDCLTRIPEGQRMLLLLRDVDDLSYNEIAEIHELPVGTVKSRLHRARTALAAAVAEYMGEGPDADQEG